MRLSALTVHPPLRKGLLQRCATEPGPENSSQFLLLPVPPVQVTLGPYWVSAVRELFSCQTQNLNQLREVHHKINKNNKQTKKIFKQQQQKSSKNTAKWWWSWINFYSQAGKLCLSLTKGSEQLNNILNEKVYENTIYGRRSLGPSPILCFSEGVCSGVTAMPFYLSKKSMWPPKAISLENIFFPN